MLRLRRRDVPVGSTFLWQQLVRDVEANAPWQRLRFSWLLLVQLLIAALVVLAAARPFTAQTSDLAANVVLIVDTSASMATRTDDEDRMALARERAATSSVGCRRADGSRWWRRPTPPTCSSARPTTATPRSRRSTASRPPSCPAT